MKVFHEEGFCDSCGEPEDEDTLKQSKNDKLKICYTCFQEELHQHGNRWRQVQRNLKEIRKKR